MSSNLKILTRSLPERTTPASSLICTCYTHLHFLCVPQINLCFLLVIWVRWECAVEPAIVHLCTIRMYTTQCIRIALGCQPFFECTVTFHFSLFKLLSQYFVWLQAIVNN